MDRQVPIRELEIKLTELNRLKRERINLKNLHPEEQTGLGKATTLLMEDFCEKRFGFLQDYAKNVHDVLSEKLKNGYMSLPPEHQHLTKYVSIIADVINISKKIANYN